MKKTNTLTHATGKQDRWSRVGLVAAMALLVSVIGGVGMAQADAAMTSTGACVRAVSDAGHVGGSRGMCKEEPEQAAPQVPSALAAVSVTCVDHDMNFVAGQWSSPDPETEYRVQVKAESGEWKTFDTIGGYASQVAADPASVRRVLGQSEGEIVGQLRVDYQTKGVRSAASKPMAFHIEYRDDQDRIVCS